jgi:hypothetical protein
MQGKAKKIKELTGFPIKKYYCKADKEAIIKWDKEEADRVWLNLQCCIIAEEASFLSRKVCPFCIKHIENYCNKNCNGCEYKENHAFCKIESDYMDILTNITEEDKRCLSNTFYLNLIKEINKK